MVLAELWEVLVELPHLVLVRFRRHLLDEPRLGPLRLLVVPALGLGAVILGLREFLLAVFVARGELEGPFRVSLRVRVVAGER